MSDKKSQFGKASTKNNAASKSNDFLLSEFNALQQRVLELERIKSSRINFFLIVFAASIAGLSGLVGSSNLEYVFPFIVLIVAFVLLLFGITTLKDVTDYSIAIVVLFRRAGRVRRWFLDNDSSIEKYVAFEPNDDRPKMYLGRSVLSWRGGEPILIIANIVTASVFVGAGLSFISIISTLIGIAITIFVLLKSQTWYIENRLKKQDTAAQLNVIFPSNPDDKKQDES